MACGIVVALPNELGSLTSQKLKQSQVITLRENILLIFSGAGPGNASLASRLLLDRGATCLVSWGCAAALAERLIPGDLTLPDAVLFEGRSYDVSVPWLEGLRGLLKTQLVVQSGAIASSGRIVASSAEKLLIYQQTGAIALDMESGAIAQVATQAGVPFLVVRAIADPVAMNLPSAVVLALDADGQIKLSKLFRHLFLNPWELPDLIRLGLHFSAAKRTLGLVAKQIHAIAEF